MFIVMNDRNVAEIGEEVEDGWQERDPVGFTVQANLADGYRDVLGVQVNPDGSITVGHWPDGEEWVVLGEVVFCAGCRRQIHEEDGVIVDETGGDVCGADGGNGPHNRHPPAVECRHCHRAIEKHDGRWVDPEATGDDSVWRETCDAHDTFVADHEPVED